ncbi:restriction endonuclease subunit S [Raoultella terrigena]|uniref:restriction endonuclease subunit S n=1 Tax=Raoultella terrigena TaxID=577 RepID=UPI0025B0EE5D|nr:restriction endonuclease subunit S [Raoultella terrigena]WJV38371.1 restriction endonuclease subunit S [Raoultella terrigena]
MEDLMVSEQRSSTSGKGVPAGFKLTEVGVIPQDWECVPFGSLFKTNIKKINVSDHEQVSFIGMQDVSEDAKLKNSTLLPFKEVKSGFTYFEKGDVLLAKITPCFENGKGCHTAELPTSVGFGSTEFHVLRENEDSDSRFIYFWTTEKKLRSSLEAEMVGSAGHRRVPLAAIKTYLIPCPKTRKEQRAIADTLSDVGDFIIASEKLIAKKQAIKTATMQQLLTGKTRLSKFALHKDGSVKGYKKCEQGEIPVDWCYTDFGKLFEPIINKKAIDSSEELSFIGMQDVSESAKLSTYSLINKRDIKSGLTYFERGDVLVAKITPCFENGKGCYTQTLTTNIGYGSTEFHVLRAKPNADPQFIYYWTTDIHFRSTLKAEMVGSAGHKRVPFHAIQAYKIPCPENKEEQTAIATILSDMDKEIQTLQQRLDKTRQLKQGMMQELLTGKTRLI